MEEPLKNFRITGRGRAQLLRMGDDQALVDDVVAPGLAMEFSLLKKQSSLTIIRESHMLLQVIRDRDWHPSELESRAGTANGAPYPRPDFTATAARFLNGLSDIPWDDCQVDGA